MNPLPSLAWNLRDNCFVEMTLQPKFSLLSLSQLANIKLGEQYKNYKVYTSKQTFHINRYEGTKITVWKSKIVVNLQKVLSFFIEDDWLKFFHKLTTKVIANLKGKLKMQFKVQGRV